MVRVLVVIDQGIETDQRTEPVKRIPWTSLQTLLRKRNAARSGLVTHVLAHAHAETQSPPLWRNRDAWTRKMIKGDARDANVTGKVAPNGHKVID
jgi:hypothetical protein